jgi:hypothetical protein
VYVVPVTDDVMVMSEEVILNKIFSTAACPWMGCAYGACRRTNGGPTVSILPDRSS